MLSTLQLMTIARWSGYFTIFCAAITVLGLILKWSFRFRLIGVTGFMGVLTGGIFALGLGLIDRPQIPGAVRFARVFDTGATQVVIVVPPQITETELDATLRQAAVDIYSPGRLSQSGIKMTIRARTVLHPKQGVSQPLFLGQVERSLMARNDEQLAIDIDHDKLAQLPKPTA